MRIIIDFVAINECAPLELFPLHTKILAVGRTGESSKVK